MPSSVTKQGCRVAVTQGKSHTRHQPGCDRTPAPGSVCPTAVSQMEKWLDPKNVWLL